MPYHYAQAAQRRLLQQRRRPSAPPPSRHPYPPGPHAPACSRQQIGAYHEAVAARFLEKHGHDILARQLHYPYGEIDLLALAVPFLVIVEVRYRSRTDYGGVRHSLGDTKIRRLRRAARAAYQQYAPQLQKQGYGDLFVRIDVILFDRTYLHWLPQAIIYE